MQTKKQEKKILFRMWRFPGFCETFLLNQIITSINCGFQTKILVEDNETFKSNPHKNLIKKWNIEKKIVIEDYGIPKNKINRFLKAISLILFNLRLIFKLYKFLKSQKFIQLVDIYKFYFLIKLNKYDLIHVQYGTNVKPLEMLKKIGCLRSKIIVSFHGHDLHFPINGRIFEKDYYIDIFKSADILIPTTEYLQFLLIQLGAPKAKIIKIPVSVDTSLFYPNSIRKNTKKLRLITVGRMDELKGQRYGIKAARKLRDKNYDFEYTLVGTGASVENLKSMVIEFKLEKQVKFVGEKSQIEVRDLLQTHDIFLMTSITGPLNSKEGQGLVTAEAQACGLPVIAFDSGGVKYTFENGETGFLVPERDVNEMANKIEELIQNDQLREQMSKAAVEYIDLNFSQKKINEIWCQVYNSLID